MVNKSLIKGLSVRLKNSSLEVSASKLGDYFACYLFVNDVVIETRKYQREPSFNFDLEKYKLTDNIEVRFYAKNKDSEDRAAKSIDVSSHIRRKFVLDSEIKIYSDHNLIILGQKLVEQGYLKLGAFNDHEVRTFIDLWEQDPFNNRSWQWRLHWFEFLQQLIAYYDSSKNDDVLDISQGIISSWFEKYLDKTSTFEFIWHDHAVALRAETLLIYYCYLKENCMAWCIRNDDYLKTIEKYLLSVKSKLAEDDFYSIHTNHGLEQARVLLLLSIYFGDQNNQKIAIDRISSELEYSFTSEGVHKENSPGYHQFVLKVFLGIISKFPDYILGDLKEKFDTVGSKALEFLAHILRPDGNLPILGDTELIKASDSYAKYFKDTSAYQDFLYSSSLGQKGSKPKETFKVYEKSGYAIYRNFWGEKDNFDQSAQLILKAGCLSRYHHQQDEGQILLYAYGEDWLIDSGLYNYIASDNIRKYMRSRRAHNIPIISNTSYSQDFSHRLAAWKLKNESNHDYVVFSTENTVLEEIKHHRKIIINNENKTQLNFEIVDCLSCLDCETRMLDFYWHFQADKSIFIEDNKVIISSKSAAMEMSFSINPSAIIESSGMRNNIITSVVSNKFNTYINSKLIRIQYSLEKDLILTTRIKMIKKDVLC